MKLACSDCARLPKCADAPADAGRLDTHTCDAWSPTTQPIIDAREDVIARFGRGALSGIRKEKPSMAHVDDLLDAVKTGDIDALNAFKSDKSVQPANLMLAAARLTGDAPALANALRGIKDPDERRVYLIDVLIGRAQSNAVANAIAAVEPPAPVAEAVEEEAPKRRRRRSAESAPAPDADVRAIEIAKESEELSAIENAKLAEAVSAPREAAKIMSLHGEDIQTIVFGVRKAVSEELTSLTRELASVSADSYTEQNAQLVNLARESSTISDRLDRIERNLARIRSAFVGFEIELIGSGTIGSTPFADATGDWE